MHVIRENGEIIRLMGMEPISGEMVEAILDFGILIIWTASEFIGGLKAKFTKDVLKTIKDMVMDFTIGLMEESFKVGGMKENNMGLDYIQINLGKKQNLVFGKWESVLSGLTKKSTIKSLLKC
jgi:hypothetical protein